MNKNTKINQILVTGGAGYIGSVLVRLLLQAGYKVRVLDNLSFGGESIVELLNDDQFEFFKGDVRNLDDVKAAMQSVDAVVHLAAIVGDPACARDPDLTKMINLEASKSVYVTSKNASVDRFVFASTCSNYGKMDNPNDFVNEESELRPVSLYAETKVAFEAFLLNQNKNTTSIPTILRFSTVYGLSPRIRFDLTVNEFTKDLVMGKELLIFGEQFWRPYCHVVDLARSVLSVLNHPIEIVGFDVFNVGDTSENYNKQMIINEILKVVPDGNVKYVQKDEDPRDYRVNFDKIKNKLGFQLSKRVPDGIIQIQKILKEGFLIDPDSPKYKNI